MDKIDVEAKMPDKITASQCVDSSFARGYNSAIEDCTLAVTKMLAEKDAELGRMRLEQAAEMKKLQAEKAEFERQKAEFEAKQREAEEAVKKQERERLDRIKAKEQEALNRKLKAEMDAAAKLRAERLASDNILILEYAKRIEEFVFVQPAVSNYESIHFLEHISEKLSVLINEIKGGVL